MKYEYKNYYGDFYSESDLNDMGQQGWELCAIQENPKLITKTSQWKFIFVFKRLLVD